MTLAHNFHCSYHRRQNIISKCGGGASGTKPLTALWLYNMLSNCSNLQQLETYANRYLHQLFPTDSHYLTKIANNKQYAAACCAMAPDIRMYGQSASSGVESMNCANKPLVREKTALDPLNAAIFLLQLEGGCFNIWKQIAWAMWEYDSAIQLVYLLCTLALMARTPYLKPQRFSSSDLN